MGKTLDSKIKNLNNDKINKEKEIKDEEERLKKLVDNCKKNIDKISKDSNKIKLDLTNNNKYLDTTPRKMKIYIIDVYKKNIEECKEKIKINKSIESKLKATIDKGNQEIKKLEEEMEKINKDLQVCNKAYKSIKKGKELN